MFRLMSVLSPRVPGSKDEQCYYSTAMTLEKCHTSIITICGYPALTLATFCFSRCLILSCTCFYFFLKVKIWFQNRRAREKRERLAKTTTGQHQIADAATLPTQARSAMELNSDKRGPSDSLGTSAEHLQSVELALLPQSNRKCHS